MSLNLHVIRAGEFIRISPEGKLDLEASRNVLAELANALHKRKINRALMDGRDMSTELTPNELATLVKAFDILGFHHDQRLALLHRGDQEYRAHLFALIGTLRGWTIRAFDDYEEALAWLALTETAPEKNRPETDTQRLAKPVPIRQKNPPPST